MVQETQENRKGNWNHLSASCMYKTTLLVAKQQSHTAYFVGAFWSVRPDWLSLDDPFHRCSPKFLYVCLYLSSTAKEWRRNWFTSRCAANNWDGYVWCYHATSGRKRPHSVEDWNQLCFSFLLFLIYGLDFPLVTIRRNTFEQVSV